MIRFAIRLSLVLALGLALPAQAQTRLTASNAANADFFGANVDVSDDGLRAVVAAPLSEAGGADDTGALYVYSRTEGGAWTQDAVLTADDAAVGDNLGTWINENPLNGGTPLAMSGDGTRVAAGALFADIDGNVDQGAVYVFTRGGDGTWSQEAKVTGAATFFTQFGFSVDLDDDGGRMIVGTRFDDLGAEDNNEGRAYIFDRSGNGDWSESARLTAAAPAAFDFFGAAVSISDDGETAVVGAPLDDSATITGNANNDAGAVYVFTRGDNGAWSQQARLESDAPVAADNLGYGVAISGNGQRIAAGAFLRDVAGNADAGAVYVYTRDEAAWTQEATLTGSGTAASSFANLGLQVSIDDAGRRVLTGAALDDFANDENQGRAYVFTRDENAAWSETAVLSETGGAPADFFGSAVALSGDAETAIVGAVFDDNPAVVDPADNNQGGAFSFSLDAIPSGVAVSNGPEGSEISGVYPNPLRGMGTVDVTLAAASSVRAVLYNTLGQRVADVHSGELAGGQRHTLRIPTAGLAAGVYVLRMEFGADTATRQLVVVR